MVVVLAAVVGTTIAMLLTSVDWTFAALVVGAIAVVRVLSDLIAWERDRRKGGDGV